MKTTRRWTGHTTNRPTDRLDGVADDAIRNVNIPTGEPFVYDFDADLRPLGEPDEHGFRGRFVGGESRRQPTRALAGGSKRIFKQGCDILRRLYIYIFALCAPVFVAPGIVYTLTAVPCRGVYGDGYVAYSLARWHDVCVVACGRATVTTITGRWGLRVRASVRPVVAQKF